MAFFRKSTMILFVVMMAAFGSTMAAVYQVGDSVGWDFHNNYDEWASSKNFQVGDTLVFSYHPQLHNVRQVKTNDYEKCSDKKPVASYNSGSDSIALQTPGDYHFISGILGHCAAGLKLHVKVSSSSSNPTNPTTAVTPPTPFPVQTPPAAPTTTSTNTPTPNTITPTERGYFDLPPGLPSNKPVGEVTRQPDSVLNAAPSKLFPSSIFLPLFLALCF